MDELSTAYLEAAGQTIERARRLLLLTLGVAGICLMAYWNFFASFSVERLSRYSAAQYWLDTSGSTTCTGQTGSSAEVCRAAVRAIQEVAEEEGIPPDMWEARKSAIKDRIDTRLDALRSETTSRRISLPSPMSGVTIDIADLGFFAGLTIMALLGILVLAVNAEIRDVDAAMRTGRDRGFGREMFELIMAKQVFTVPVGRSALNRALRYSTELFFAFPLLAQTCGLSVHLYYRFLVPGAPTRAPIVDFGVPAAFFLASIAMTYELFALEGRFRRALVRSAEDVGPEVPNR